MCDYESVTFNELLKRTLDEETPYTRPDEVKGLFKVSTKETKTEICEKDAGKYND